MISAEDSIHIYCLQQYLSSFTDLRPYNFPARGIMHYRDGTSVGFYIFMHRYVYADLNMLTSTTIKSLGSCDRASWAKYEERETTKMQQLDVYY